MLSEKFSWISFYRELANALLKHRDDRSELLTLIYKNPVIASLCAYLHMQNGDAMTDIDPFSFFLQFLIEESNRLSGEKFSAS